MLIFYTVETQVRWLYGHMAIEFTLSDHLSVCLSLCLGRANAPVEYEKISNLLIWRNIINCHWNIIFCFSSLIFSIFFFFQLLLVLSIILWDVWSIINGRGKSMEKHQMDGILGLITKAKQADLRWKI